jgi:hypothetical protein
MNENMFNIEHLLKVEQEGQEDEQYDLDSYPHEDKIDLGKLLRSSQGEDICTFGPDKVSQRSSQHEVYDSLNQSLQEIESDKKNLMLCSIKQFKKQLIDMIVIINNFFDNFTTELHSRNDIDEVYKNYLISLEQIKQSMNEIFYTAEASFSKEKERGLKIDSLKSDLQQSLKLESSLKNLNFLDSKNNSEKFSPGVSSKFGISNFFDSNGQTKGSKFSNNLLNESVQHNKSTCNNNNMCTINHVIDRLITEYKEQNGELKKDIEKFKNRIYIYENLIISSKRLIEDIYDKNRKLKEKLIKYKNSK